MKSIVRPIALSAALAFGGFAATSAAAQPIPPEEAGWVLRQEQGSCLAQKGADKYPRFQMTSRGRILLSSPNLGDQYFAEGQPASLRLVWSDGVEETVDAAQIALPGGGPQNLSPRQVYVFPHDTTNLAERFPAGFTLLAFRDDVQVFTFDGRDAGAFLRSFNECEDKIGVVTPSDD